MSNSKVETPPTSQLQSCSSSPGATVAVSSYPSSSHSTVGTYHFKDETNESVATMPPMRDTSHSHKIPYYHERPLHCMIPPAQTFHSNLSRHNNHQTYSKPQGSATADKFKQSTGLCSYNLYETEALYPSMLYHRTVPFLDRSDMSQFYPAQSSIYHNYSIPHCPPLLSTPTVSSPFLSPPLLLQPHDRMPYQDYATYPLGRKDFQPTAHELVDREEWGGSFIENGGWLAENQRSSLQAKGGFDEPIGGIQNRDISRTEENGIWNGPVTQNRTKGRRRRGCWVAAKTADSMVGGRCEERQEISRCRMLDEFSRHNRQYPLKDIMPYVVEFARDQFGHQYVQTLLDTASENEKQEVFEQLLKEIKRLSTDKFGNYLIQLYLETGTDEHRRSIIESLEGEAFRLSLQTYGCRILQKAFETAPSDLQTRLLKELAPHIMQCVEDQNGNHVIQKGIERMGHEQLQFVVDSFKGQTQNTSKHVYGCRVIQRLLEHCPQEQMCAVLDEIMHDVVPLCENQYGNYVVQHVLEFGRPKDKTALVDLICDNVLKLATNRFASNVVEKAVVCSSEAGRTAVFEASLKLPTDQGPPPLLAITRDRYGNYVVQRMLDMATPEERERLVEALKGELPTLRKISYGKHIVTALERTQKQSSEAPSPSSDA